MSARKIILPAGWTVKRVDDDKVVIMQEMKDETSTFVVDMRDGVVNSVLYRLASALADIPVVDPIRDGLLAALVQAERFIVGFAGDELQEGVDELLDTVRAAIAKATGEAS